MIAATLLAAHAWLAAPPSGIRWTMAGIAAELVLIAAAALWLHFHDALVVAQHEDARQATAKNATVKSAEERSADAIEGLVVEQARETAIAKAKATEAAKPIEQRAALPPTTIALNCPRLLHA